MQTQTASRRLLSREEVARHNTRDDLWVIVDGDVYNLSPVGSRGAAGMGFAHPGGMPPLLDCAGRDATALFFGLHRRSVLEEARNQ